ncbi:MAG: hypothetical protein QM656_03700 [Paracoccaceae bacterium]
MQFSTRHVVKRIARRETLPPASSDISIFRHPYPGATHLMDVRFVMTFHGGGVGRRNAPSGGAADARADRDDPRGQPSRRPRLSTRTGW